jgi:flagellar basal-body rod protein FlgB
MIANLFNASTVPVLEQVLNFTQARHELLAGNIANVHTPGYRARDLSEETFQSALKKLFETHEAPEFFSQGMASPRQTAMHQVKESRENILYHDGTDMDIERQVVQISKNQGLHNLAVSIMTSQFKLLETAVSERV